MSGMRRTYKRVKREISVRETTYERLKALAQKNNEHISTTLDSIINLYLNRGTAKP